MKKLTILISFLVSLTLISCGGGGGNDPGGTVNNYNVNLKNVVFSDGQISPRFSSDKTSYNIEVSSTTSSVKISTETADSKAKITLNETEITSGSSITLPLSPDLNPVSIKVTAPDNITVKTYNFSIKRLKALSGNANLAGIEVSEGVLSPAFHENTTGYNIDLPTGTKSITLYPTVAGVNATVKVNGVPVESGFGSTVSLQNGITVIRIEVTAANGTVKNYVVAVNNVDGNSNADLAYLSISAGTLSPGFDPDTVSYTVYVPYIAGSITVTPTVAVSGSTVKVNKMEVSSGTASGSITLTVGANSILVSVMAEDKTEKEYTILVYRIAADTNPNLANMSISAGILSPLFDSDTTAYNVSADYHTSSITVTPTVESLTSVVTVNGVLTVSGTASDDIELGIGNNLIEVVVIAENGNTKTYRIVINRIAADTNANLAGLALSTGTLTPTFSVNTVNYTVDVPYATSGIRIRPTAASTKSVITVKNTAIASGTYTETISLGVGENKIPVEVTAEDGTKRTYTVNVSRTAANTNASLSGITLTSGTLSPAFGVSTYSYTAEIPYSVSGISVEATASGLNAVIMINKVKAYSGNYSNSISMGVGSNTINIVVTAEDGVTTKTYTLTVNRVAASYNANLAGLTLSAGVLDPVLSEGTVNYRVVVPYSTSSIKVTPTVAGLNAKVTVNGTSVVSGAASGSIGLELGDNKITVVVTAESGYKQTYTLIVCRMNGDAFLSGLTVSQGVLPAFRSWITSYVMDVPYNCLSLNITPFVSTDLASVTVNGISVVSGTASGEISLSPGMNTITIAVTDKNGITVTYTVVVYRLDMSGFKIFISGSYTMILKSDGTLWATGYTNYTTFNDGSIKSILTPVQVMSGVADVAICSDHTMILKSDGTLWAMGRNDSGQLGDGTTDYKLTPVQVMTGVADVAVAYGYTMILKSDGTLWATGYNYYGQLGDGTTKTNRLTPVQVMTDVANVYPAGSYTMILKTDGTLWGTGDNSYAYLGDGTNTNRSTPVQVMTDVANVYVAGNYTMILKSNGTLWATGENNCGQLGDGTISYYRSPPIQVMSDVADVAVGSNYTMILKSDGTLWAAGKNDTGQLGDGTTVYRPTPVKVMSDVANVIASNNFTIILKSDRTLWSTGYGYLGQLEGNRSIPVQAMSGVADVAVGPYYIILHKIDGTFWATGGNYYGNFGNGTTTSSSSFIQLPW